MRASHGAGTAWRRKMRARSLSSLSLLLPPSYLTLPPSFPPFTPPHPSRLYSPRTRCITAQPSPWRAPSSPFRSAYSSRRRPRSSPPRPLTTSPATTSSAADTAGTELPSVRSGPSFLTASAPGADPFLLFSASPSLPLSPILFRLCPILSRSYRRRLLPLAVTQQARASGPAPSRATGSASASRSSTITAARTTSTRSAAASASRARSAVSCRFFSSAFRLASARQVLPPSC